MLAEIFSGEVDNADLFFLFATILAVAAGVLYLVADRRVPPDRVRVGTLPGALLSFAVACAAFGFLLL